MEIAKYPKDPEVAKKALEQLWWICVNAEKQKRIGAFKGGCKALIITLQVTQFFIPLSFRRGGGGRGGGIEIVCVQQSESATPRRFITPQPTILTEPLEGRVGDD